YWCICLKPMESDPAHHRNNPRGAHGSVIVRSAPVLAVLDGGALETSEPRGYRDGAHPRLLSLDAHGHILDWISWQDAACLYVRDAVAWTLGDPCLTIHGGWNRETGEQSLLDLHPIIAARGHARGPGLMPSPALTN